MNRVLGLVLAVAVLVGLGFVVTCVYTVSQTQQVALVEFGAPIGIVREPGLHLKSPLQRALFFDRRLLNLDVLNQDILTLDNKHAVLDVYARWRITNPLLFSAQQDSNIAADNLKALVSSNMRDVLGQQNLAVLFSARRPSLMRQIAVRVNRDVHKFGAEIVDVRIRRERLPAEDTDAVYQRMKKELEAQATKNRAEGDRVALEIHAGADREAATIKAQALAEAAAIKGEGDATRIAITAPVFNQDPQFYAFWRSMQAYQDSLGANTTTMVLSPKSEFLKYFGDGPGAAGKKK
jgi:membrane protease subunit HflC